MDRVFLVFLVLVSVDTQGSVGKDYQASLDLVASAATVVSVVSLVHQVSAALVARLVHLASPVIVDQVSLGSVDQVSLVIRVSQVRLVFLVTQVHQD